MDQQYIKEHQVIERFVLNQLSEKELDEFLVYQMMHPEINSDIEEERGRMKSVRALKHINTSNSSSKNKWWWFAGTFILVFAAWFFLMEIIIAIFQLLMKMPQ